MIKNTKLYPESRLKELQDLTDIPYQEIKKDIFKLIGDEVDLSIEPFSKLKKGYGLGVGVGKMKKLVGYGFSLPLKPSLFNIGSFDLLGFLFDGRLKPYPTEFYVVVCKERGRSPVGGDCYHTIMNLIFKIKFFIYYLLEIGAMAIASYGCFKNHKHYNLSYFSQELFFNVKLLKKL